MDICLKRYENTLLPLKVQIDRTDATEILIDQGTGPKNSRLKWFFPDHKTPLKTNYWERHAIARKST